jgi:hypothetical protein
MIQHGCPTDSCPDAAPQEWPHLSEIKKNLHSCLSVWPWSSMAAHLSAPFPHCMLVGLPRCAIPQSSAAPCALAPCTASSLVVHPSPIAVEHAVDPTMAAGAHMSWRLVSFRPSQEHPRAWLVLVVLACHHSLPDPTPTTGIDPSRPSPSLCCKCMFQTFQMLQLVHMDIAKVDRDVAHVAYFYKCFQWYVPRFWKMFHLF